MAGDLNRATLIGRLGKDPEGRSTQGGGRVVSFSLATGNSWTDKNTGEKRETTQWHNVVIWNEGIGKIAEQYLRKGSKCMVEGNIETRKWKDRDGNDRWSTEVVLRNFGAQLILLDGKSDRDDGDRPGRDDSGGRGPAAKSGHDDFNDEIPF
jgi:single-strand DNA-binding protein